MPFFLHMAVCFFYLMMYFLFFLQINLTLKHAVQPGPDAQSAVWPPAESTYLFAILWDISECTKSILWQQHFHLFLQPKSNLGYTRTWDFSIVGRTQQFCNHSIRYQSDLHTPICFPAEIVALAEQIQAFWCLLFFLLLFLNFLEIVHKLLGISKSQLENHWI